MKIIKAAILLLFVVVVTACTYHNAPAETRYLSVPNTYDAISISHAFDVIMSKNATEPAITLSANLFDDLVFEVVKGTLKIGFRPGFVGANYVAKVTLPLHTSLSTVQVSGASSFVCREAIIESKMLTLQVSGASEIECPLQATLLHVELGGASNAKLSGQADEMIIVVGGASDLRAKQCGAAVVKGEIGGSSNAEVSVCESLRVELSGSSNLKYHQVDASCNLSVDCPVSGGSTVSFSAL